MSVVGHQTERKEKMTESPQTVWTRCMEFFRNNLKNEQAYKTWFVPIRFKSFDAQNGIVVLYIPTEFFYEYLEANYRKLLFAALYRFFGQGIQLKYEIGVIENQVVERIAEARPSTSIVQAIDSQLNNLQTFDNFIEGNCNKLPRSVGKAISEHPEQKAFNPLFIYGPSGVGKTHLANAIGVLTKQLHPRMRVLYLSAHLFQVQYTDSIRKNTFNDFMHFYQNIDLLIMDDIQELMGSTKTQYAFFHIFNHLRQIGKQIVLTSDRPPVALAGMSDRLITRFQCGLLAELEKPDEELRHKILESKIKHDGLSIPQDVIDYISANANDNIRELEGIVNSLLAKSVVFGKEIDLELAKKILKKNTYTEKKEPTIEEILGKASQICHVSLDEIVGKSRKAEIVECRQLSIFIAQKHTQLTHSKIGLLIGNRNHATVIHSIKNIEKRLKEDKELQEKLKEIEQNLNC